MTATFRSALDHIIGPEGVLSIRFASGGVRLRAVDGTAVHVRDRGDHDIAGMFEIDRADGSLSLRIEHGRGWFLAKGHTPDLDVDVPRGAAVVIESASGDIEGDGLAGDQHYRTTSGDVVLRRCAGRVGVDAVSGDIDVVAAAEIDLSARTVSGDLVVRAGTLRGLRASTTSGDLKVAGRFASEGAFTIETVSGDGLVAPVGDIKIEMTTVTGDLHSDLPGRTEGGRGHRSLVIGSGGPVMAFRSLSGDLRITRPAVMEPPDTAENRAATPAPTTQEPTAGARSHLGSAEPVPAPVAAPPVAADPAPTERAASADRWEPPATTPASASAEPAAAATVDGETAAEAATGSEPAVDDARMEILRSLERGEIDVAEAAHRLEALDAGSASAQGASDA